MIKKVLWFIFVLLFISCDYFKKSNNNISTYRIAKLNSNSLDKILFTWETPDLWIKNTPSQMRLASFSIPYSNGNADLSISQLNGDGGGVVQNVNRWRRQLKLPALDLNQIQSSSIIEKSKIGKYSIYEIINSQDSSKAFLATIMPLKNQTIFVKLNSTINGIKEIRHDFINFCSSFSPK